MFVVLVIGAVVLGAVLVSLRLSRPENETILDFQRALAALRDAERAHSPTPDETTPGHARTDHVHILGERPAGAADPGRRPSTRRHATQQRRNPADAGERPTIASLPTTEHVRAVRFPAPTDASASVEPVPKTQPSDLESEEPRSTEPRSPALSAGQPISGSRRGWRRPTTRLASALGVLMLALAVAVVIGVDHATPHRVTVQRPRSRPIRPSLPSTTQPPRTTSTVASVVATAAGNGTVTVAVPFTLTLAPTGTCWVSVSADTGQTLYVDTMHAGQRQQVEGSGPLVVRLGDTSAMSLILNGTQLDLSGVAPTANIQFATK